MPDWTQDIGPSLAKLKLKLEAGREAEIVEELSQHLDGRYAALRSQGLDEAAAVALVRAELRADTPELAERMRPRIWWRSALRSRQQRSRATCPRGARRAAAVDPIETLKAD